MTARCKVCHREMSNPAHIAQGMGPVCASRLAAKATMRDRSEQRAYYPVERYERIVRGVRIIAQHLSDGYAYLNWARQYGTAEELAVAEWDVTLRTHWYKRAERMERRARRLLAPHAA